MSCYIWLGDCQISYQGWYRIQKKNIGWVECHLHISGIKTHVGIWPQKGIDYKGENIRGPSTEPCGIPVESLHRVYCGPLHVYVTNLTDGKQGCVMNPVVQRMNKRVLPAVKLGRMRTDCSLVDVTMYIGEWQKDTHEQSIYWSLTGKDVGGLFCEH